MQRNQIFVQNRVFCLPNLHSTPPLGGSRRNIATPFGMEKLEWWGYPMVKKILKICLFVLTCVEFYLYPTVGTALIHSVKPELTE